MSVLTRWRSRLRIRERLATAARRRYVWHPTASNRITLARRRAQVAFAKRVIARRKPRFEVIDNCPVPRQIAPAVRALKRDVPTAVLQSCYRGDTAAGLLKRLGKSTQAMLYRGWLRRLPGFNPANPPGRSTHELRSDGVAYRGPVGRPLFTWQVGMDWNADAVPAIIAAGKRRGWNLWRPYPSGSERHHLNFRSRPKGGYVR